jgi:hypothetical protein
MRRENCIRGEFGLPKEMTCNYSKVELLSDLELAGFDAYIARDIADRVDRRKQGDWTYERGREEAIRQAQLLLENGHNALDTFRSSTLSRTGHRDYVGASASYAERIADT